MTVLQSSHPDLAEHLLDARYTRRIYAEGDSWFSSGGIFNGSLLDAIARIRPNWLIVSSAYPGDELSEMNDVSSGEYQWMLMPTDGMPPWDALLISGGGNDLLKHAGDMADADGLLVSRVHATLQKITSDMDDMVRKARLAQRNLPIFINCYDFPWPVASDTPWIPGPWMGPDFINSGLPAMRWHEVALEMVNALHAAFYDVACHHENVYLVDGRGILSRPVQRWLKPMLSDWANEIHPSARGYDKHAQRWASIIDYHTAPAGALN